MEFPGIYAIGSDGKLNKTNPPEDLDPRGLVLILEPPIPTATYYLGCDPTVGIPMWDRQLRTRNDLKTDNGAIEILRKGTLGRKDVQVAEYAAPIDPEDLADIVNCLGRLYAGNSEFGMCETIIEVYPGPGLMTQRKLINKYDYTNLFVWKYLDSMAVKATNSLGWQSTVKSKRDLWIRGTRHISRDQVRVTSPHLAEELAHCEADPLKMTGKAAYGHHDDRVTAFLLAIWAANNWDFATEEREVEVTPFEKNEWQSSGISVTDMYEAWEDRFQQLQED